MLFMWGFPLPVRIQLLRIFVTPVNFGRYLIYAMILKCIIRSESIYLINATIASWRAFNLSFLFLSNFENLIKICRKLFSTTTGRNISLAEQNKTDIRQTKTSQDVKYLHTRFQSDNFGVIQSVSLSSHGCLVDLSDQDSLKN